MSTTTQEPDFKAIAERMGDEKYPGWMYRDMGRYNRVARNAYASCMEAKLRQDWETIRLLRNVKSIMHRAGHVDVCPMASLWNPGPCNCGLDAAFIDVNAHLSTLEAQFK